MRKINEWTINDALHAFFMDDSEYMLIFQDPELSIYLDRILVPRTEAQLGRKLVGKNKQLAETRRETSVSINPIKFRPDASLLDRRGRVNILETKISKVSTAAECDELVIQALAYAKWVISPGWVTGTTPTTYDVVEDLHEAHWSLKVHWEGIYRRIEERHRKYFGLQTPLDPQDFCKIPTVIFLGEKLNQDGLVEACKRIKQLSFPDYKEYGIDQKRSSRFQQRLATLEDSWDKLQSISFSMMRLNVAKFIEVIDSQIIPIVS